MENSNAEEKLISSVSLAVHNLMNALSDAAFLCDYSGNVLLCSDAAVDFFGFKDKSRILGSDFLSFFAYEFVDDAFSMFRKTSLSPESRNLSVFQMRMSNNETRAIEVIFACLSPTSINDHFILVTFKSLREIEPAFTNAMRNESRLDKLCEILFRNEEDSIRKATKFLAYIGTTLGANTCSYLRYENNIPISSMQWESPFNTCVTPNFGSKQLAEILSESSEKIILIRKPVLNTIFEAENFQNDAANVKAILGINVMHNGSAIGLISMVFTSVFLLSESEKIFLGKMSKGFTAILNDKNLQFSEFGKAEFNRDLLDCFVDSIYILDSDGVFLEANKGASQLYGYNREEMIGQTPEFFSAPGKNDLMQTMQYVQNACNGESQKFEWWGLKKNGEIFPKEIVLSPANIKGRNLVIAVCRDITERNKIEQELLKSNQELQETNVSKDKFFSILAHDLKNPFQGLLGFIDLLYEDLEELTTDQIKEYLFNVRSASYHTYNLLENLLDWSRIQSGKMPFTPTIFDISDEIDSIINVLQSNATRKEIRLVNEVSEHTMVEADRNMIHSVVQNLITNSIKFSNTQGKVTIRSRQPKNLSKNPATTESAEKQWLEISVSDNGIGIPDELLPKLFRLNGQFSQSGTANEPGTGLGLVLCREMVEKNGGKIWAESIPDQGATFIFTLPLSN